MQILQEPVDRHVGDREEPVEGDAEALGQFGLIVGLQFVLRWREPGPERVIHQVQDQPAPFLRVTQRVECLQRGDAAIVDSLAALLIHILLEIAWKRGDDLDLMVGQKLWEMFLAAHEKDSQVTPVHHVSAHRPALVHQVVEMRIHLRRAAGDIHRAQLRIAPHHRQHRLHGLPRHDLGPGGPRVHVAMRAGLVA